MRAGRESEKALKAAKGRLGANGFGDCCREKLSLTAAVSSSGAKPPKPNLAAKQRKSRSDRVHNRNMAVPKMRMSAEMTAGCGEIVLQADKTAAIAPKSATCVKMPNLCEKQRLYTVLP